MKKLLILFTILFMTLSLHVKGEDQHKNSTDYVMLQPKRPSHRPQAPSMLSVGCEYGNGYLAFTLPENVSTLTFRLYNDNDEIAGMVTYENPVAEITALHGEYNIECVDDGNRTYVGVLYFQ